MAQRGLLVLLTALFNCVLSSAVTSSQLENEDVKVMKCIVEVLVDVLSRPHAIPVSQECLSTLKTDDRLVTILRHRKFLKELQEIAVQGGQKRAYLQGDTSLPVLMTQTPQIANDVADRSMLEALGGPGERSILSQKEVTDTEDETYEKMSDIMEDGHEDGFKGARVNKEHEEKPRSHVSEPVKRREEEEEEEEDGSDERRVKERHVNEGVESGEKRDPRRSKTKEKKSDREHEEEKERRSALVSHQHESRHQEEKREHEESLKHWTKRSKSPSLRKKAATSRIQDVSDQQEVPHHSKEVSEETEEEKHNAKRSPEEQELQMIAHRTPEERRGAEEEEEEGSASRKSEEPEIESLAAIESELENVAQKLHGLRHG